MSAIFLKIHDLFLLSSGTTVIACDKPEIDRAWADRKVCLVSVDGDKRQEIIISGLRSMSRQGAHHDQIAIETRMPVQLSVEEAQSGHWLIEA